MPNPTGRDLHVNRPLTNISVAYLMQSDRFIADRVFPVVPVANQSDIFFTYAKGDWFRTQVTQRAPGTESPGAGWRVSTTPYYTPVYSIHKDLDDQTRANADAVFNLDRDATRWVTEQLLLKRDQLFVSSFMTTGIWTGPTSGTDITGVAAAPGANQVLQWNDAAATPIENITRYQIEVTQKTGQRGNVLVLGPAVWQALRNHPTILDRIKYSERGVITEDLVAQLFGVDRILVAWAIQNTGPDGGTDSFSFLVNKSALLVYAPASAGLLEPSGGYIFSWSGLLGAGALGTRIKRFRMEAVESDRIEGEMAFSMQVIASDVGVFFNTIVA